jgi:hypothetical protein
VLWDVLLRILWIANEGYDAPLAGKRFIRRPNSFEELLRCRCMAKAPYYAPLSVCFGITSMAVPTGGCKN